MVAQSSEQERQMVAQSSEQEKQKSEAGNSMEGYQASYGHGHVYRIQRTPTGKSKFVHHDRLRKAYFQPIILVVGLRNATCQ